MLAEAAANSLKQRTAWLSIISNSALVIIKLIVGLHVGAVSLISEAAHSGVDLVAAMIAFFAVKKAVEPPDEEHAYGHGKFENLSGAIEALLIVFAAILIIYESIEKFSTMQEPEYLEYGIIIMAISITINYLVSKRLIKVAHQTESQALEADGLHLQADIWTSVGVLAGLVAIKTTGWIWLDPVIAILVAGIIFKTGWDMTVESTKELTDVSLPAEDEAIIKYVINSHKEIVNCHRLRTRRSGSYRILDVHIVMDGMLPLKKVHDICDIIERQIKEKLGMCDVMIHAEPDDKKRGEEK
jgi:cation diffusion facilitator family transporter